MVVIKICMIDRALQLMPQPTRDDDDDDDDIYLCLLTTVGTFVRHM